MGNQGKGKAVMVRKSGKEPEYAFAAVTIEERGGLVQKQQFWLGDNRSGYRCSLVLPSGQVLYRLVRKIGYAACLQSFLDCDGIVAVSIGQRTGFWDKPQGYQLPDCKS